jgi:hypothetical protein
VRHVAELVRRRQRWASAGRDGSAITMHGIEIAVDGGGGDWRQQRNGRQDGRVTVAGQGDGVSPSYLLDFNERDILHTTGIHKQVGAPKKVRKKGAHLLCFEKGENGGLTFFTFFSIVE